MSYYYKYDFISPAALYALIEEELRSYFSTGVVDTLLFPIYTEKCLKKLGKGSYKIEQTLLPVKDSTAKLPLDFKYVREVWATTSCTESYQLPGALYEQISTCLTDPRISCDLDLSCDIPEEIKVVYKTNLSELYTFTKSHLLQPGNIHTEKYCYEGSPNISTRNGDLFDIRDKKLLTQFQEGFIYLTYYSENLTEEGYQLVPDNYAILEYLEAFIKYKMFELISNSVTDETYNQVMQKLQMYENKANEKYILADIEIKKRTPQRTAASVARQRRKFSRYNIL